MPYRNQEWESKGHPGPLLQPVSVQAAAAAAPPPSVPAGSASVPVPGGGPAAAGASSAPDSVPTAPASCAASVQSTTRDAVQVGKSPKAGVFFIIYLFFFCFSLKALKSQRNSVLEFCSRIKCVGNGMLGSNWIHAFGNQNMCV